MGSQGQPVLQEGLEKGGLALSVIKAVSEKNGSDCGGQRGARAWDRAWIPKGV